MGRLKKSAGENTREGVQTQAKAGRFSERQRNAGFKETPDSVSLLSGTAYVSFDGTYDVELAAAGDFGG